MGCLHNHTVHKADNNPYSAPKTPNQNAINDQTTPLCKGYIISIVTMLYAIYHAYASLVLSISRTPRTATPSRWAPIRLLRSLRPYFRRRRRTPRSQYARTVQALRWPLLRHRRAGPPTALLCLIIMAPDTLTLWTRRTSLLHGELLVRRRHLWWRWSIP